MAYRWATRLMCRRAAKKQVVRSLLAHRGPQYGQQSWSPFLQKDKKQAGRRKPAAAALPRPPTARSVPSPEVTLSPDLRRYSLDPAPARRPRLPSGELRRSGSAGSVGTYGADPEPGLRLGGRLLLRPSTVCVLLTHLPEQEETHPLFPVS